MIQDEARERLKGYLLLSEGCVLHAYQDSEGWWTIGVGHLIDARKGGTIPARIADDLLEGDIDTAVTALIVLYPWFADQDPVRQVVLVELMFNLGAGGLAGFVNTLAAFKRGDYPAAAAGLKKSKWYRQVQASRSARILNMVLTGEFP